jgi:glycosyltransferase involved in cell wall biosynthesis
MSLRAKHSNPLRFVITMFIGRCIVARDCRAALTMTNIMNIGIDIRTLMDRRYSGVSLYTLNLVNSILEQDKNNTYKLFYNCATDIKLPKFSRANVEIVHTRFPNKIFNYALQKTLDWPKIDRKMGVDLFFMPHVNFISLTPDCQKIITVHDLSYLRYPQFFSWRKNIWHKITNVKLLLKKFDKIIAVSENTKNDIVDLLKIPADKIRVIYSGINDNYRRVTDHEELKRIKLKYTLPDKFIFYLSTIEPRKNVSAIIKSFEMLSQDKSLDEYYLVIAGCYGWKYKKDLKILENSIYKNRIKFLGYVAEEDKPALYSLSDAFIYPSFYEGFGFPPLEAAACGCPVITSFAPSLPEIIKGMGIMVNPYDVNELKSAFYKIINDQYFSNKSQNQADRVNKFYNWKKTANEYIEIFNNIK